jgi:transmembrane sensor
MNITEDLILQFFQGKCNRAETMAVLHYLEENPAAAEKYLGKSEWEQVIAAADKPLPDAQRNSMLAHIKSATFKKRSIKQTTYPLAIAASILLVMFIGFQVYNYSKKPSGLVNLNQQQNAWQHINNTSIKDISLVLKDGTKVKLYANSQLSLPRIPSQHKRDVRLSGKAFFDVAKDKERPFTVISGPVSTTALGTQFTVDAYKENVLISVKLYEGRVLIKSIHTPGKEANIPVHLYPNQELVYKKLTGLMELKHFGKIPENKNLVGERQGGQKNFDITFEREPIENVFAAIEQAYQINLIYPREVLKDHYFSGSFHIKEDSLIRVLHILSETNKLNITKTKSGYMITKQR